MSRYLTPSLIYLAFAVVTFSGEDFGFGFAGMLALYAVGSLWWVVVAATTRQPSWKAFALAFVPAILPLVMAIEAVRLSSTTDVAVLAAIVSFQLAAAALLLGAAGALVLFVRRRRQILP